MEICVKVMKKKKSEVYIFIGIAGSGKSSLIKKFQSKTGLKSYDILKIMKPYIKKYGSVTEKNKSVLDEVVSKWVESFPKKRFDILELANGYYLPKVIEGLKKRKLVVIYCKCPLYICKQRNALRDRLVPPHFLKHQSKFKTSYYQKLSKKYDFELRIIDMKQDRASCLEQLLKKLYD